MRALVTGSAGLVGRWMIKRLEADGWDVTEWDLVDGNDARICFQIDKNRYDLVVHAAYHIGGRAGIDGVNRNFAQNLQLDAAMFDWAVKTQQRRVLYFSSSAAYPVRYQSERYVSRPDTPTKLAESRINLESPKLPDAGYGWAKLTGEMLARDTRKNGVGVTVVRPFSGYAEDQSIDYPFTAIVDRAIRGEHTVWGPMGQTRDWIYMTDVVDACMTLAMNDEPGPVNLCTGRAVTMSNLMRKIVNELHLMMPHEYPHGDEISVQHLADKPTGVFHRVGDPTEMLKHHAPQVSLEAGIRRAIGAAFLRLDKKPY